MYESFTEYLTSVYGFGGRYRFEETFVQLCWKCLQDIYKLGILPLSSQFEYNIMSGTRNENKRSKPWLNFEDTSKFWVEKYIGSSRLNIFESHLQMTHELSLKVYKVKSCLLRLKCRVSSNYKTQVLFPLDRSGSDWITHNTPWRHRPQVNTSRAIGKEKPLKFFIDVLISCY